LLHEIRRSGFHTGKEKAMPKEFKLPDLGEGIHEGEILAVRVKTGDKVKDG